MVRQDITSKEHKKLMDDLEQKLIKALSGKRTQQCLSMFDIMTVWQRVMSKVKNGK